MFLNIENLKERERAIWRIKRIFENELSRELNLIRVSAPLCLVSGTGINDDLNGTERKVSFKYNNVILEVPQSLAKWKRLALKHYDMNPGEGLWTYMNALRPDEVIDPFHSLYVDQYDWERVITEEERRVEFLVDIVKKIYKALLVTEEDVEKTCKLKRTLPQEITFIHSSTLKQLFPELTPKQREYEICKQYKAVFIIGIGSKLIEENAPHDNRAPDYDDWSTPTLLGPGLNGDLLVWNTVLEQQMELSSMGIRVNRESLNVQLFLNNCTERETLEYHKTVLNNDVPLSIGGGIGQARLLMFLLQRRHLNEVVSSYWDGNISCMINS